jgi:hypothetical protein
MLATYCDYTCIAWLDPGWYHACDNIMKRLKVRETSPTVWNKTVGASYCTPN